MKKSDSIYSIKTVLILSGFITLLLSCHETKRKEQIDYTGFSEKRFFLTGIDKKKYEQTDTLAEIVLKIPDRLDTFYQWHNYSDCLPCGRLQYRFSDTRFSRLAESGWFWDCVKDSVYQLTFIHNPIREAPDSIKIRHFTIADSGRYGDYGINEAVFCEEILIQKKEFTEINKRIYSIVNFTSSCSQFNCGKSLFVSAKTVLNNRYLCILGECSLTDSSDFINMMYKTIRSIEIKE